jgi:FkbM family methyltransferase
MPTRFLRSAVRRALRRSGWEIVPSTAAGTMEGALRRLSGRHEVRTVIDVGASNGRWSELARPFFPGARFLLVEAQAAPHEPGLRALRQRWPGMDYVLAAAGDREGEVHFDAGDPLGGAASPEPFPENDVVVPMTTVDAEVARRGLGGPFLLKLDTHGFEVPILEGASRTLREASLVVVEAYNFELRPGCLRFGQMCDHLERRGLRCIDLVDVMRRPADGALWQMDLFFAPRSRPEFAVSLYR